MAISLWVNIGSDNGLSTEGTKPLPETIIALASKVFCDINLRAVPQAVRIVCIRNACSNISKLLPHPQEPMSQFVIILNIMLQEAVIGCVKVDFV